MKTTYKTLACVSVFAVAMGFFESAVVIYLRALYYPEGFQFPLKVMNPSLSAVEILREAATILMLIATGYLAGKTKLQRFAYFNLAFAIWDLCYYLFLYLVLRWPQSPGTWDILFLIPLPWAGPVWAPCLISLLMLAGSVFVIVQCAKNKNYHVAPLHWWLLLSGAAICIFSFTLDFIRHYMNSNYADILSSVYTYLPQSFNYPLFFTGFALMCYPVLLHLFTSKNNA